MTCRIKLRCDGRCGTINNIGCCCRCFDVCRQSWRCSPYLMLSFFTRHLEATRATINIKPVPSHAYARTTHRRRIMRRCSVHVLYLAACRGIYITQHPGGATVTCIDRTCPVAQISTVDAILMGKLKTVSGSEIEHVTTFKLLGVIIDCNLKWNEHVDYLCSGIHFLKQSKRAD